MESGAGDFEALWRDLAPVGRVAGGGYRRQPFTAAEREARAWFDDAARARDLELEADGYGNVVAWWTPPGASGSAVLTGSHLDSVVDGGAYDGPLGVVSALAAIDELRARGVVPTRPIGVAVFAEEEGSRFGLACLGSRLATGTATVTDLERRDADGTAYADALAGAGLDPTAGSSLLAGVDCFVELHVEQGRALVDHDAAVGVASGIWPHGRWRLTVDGRADHAGTTRMEDRADPMLTYAMTVLAANKQARLAGARATFGRVSVAPNATNAIASRVTAWLDARAESTETLNTLVGTIERSAVERAGRDGTTATLTAESVSPAVAFREGLLGFDVPVLPTQAGHDAGVLSAAGIPTAMLFVRNPTGVSHSPAEHAPMADCLTGVRSLADALARLAA